MTNKFKKNDQVIIISGSSKGKKGKILSIKNDKVLIKDINLATIHKKPTNNNPGQILKKEMPIHISNVSHIENNLPVKIKFVIEKIENSKDFMNKKRVSKKTDKKID